MRNICGTFQRNMWGKYRKTWIITNDIGYLYWIEWDYDYYINGDWLFSSRKPLQHGGFWGDSSLAYSWNIPWDMEKHFEWYYGCYSGTGLVMLYEGYPHDVVYPVYPVGWSNIQSTGKSKAEALKWEKSSIDRPLFHHFFLPCLITRAFFKDSLPFMT